MLIIGIFLLMTACQITPEQAPSDPIERTVEEEIPEWQKRVEAYKEEVRNRPEHPPQAINEHGNPIGNEPIDHTQYADQIMENIAFEELIDNTKIEPGTRIGVFEVGHIENEIRSSIPFIGTAIVTGHYHDASEVGGMGPNGICMYNLDEASKVTLPFKEYAPLGQRIKNDLDRRFIRRAEVDDYLSSICFDHEEAIRKGFPKATAGEATVLISDFILDLLGLEGKSNRATLHSILSIEPQKWLRSVEIDWDD